MYIRTHILRETKREVQQTFKERFDKKKFIRGMFGFDLVGWAKDIYSLFNVRKLIMYGILISLFYGYGWYKGRMGKPVTFDFQYEKEFYIKLDGHYLHKPKNSKQLEILDKEGHKIKDITVSDIPELQRKLKPYGFQLKPIGVLGICSTKEFEGGAGISFLKYWAWRLETFLTNKGIYIGTSYKLDKIKLENSSIGVGIGKGFKEGDNRILFYYRWNF